METSDVSRKGIINQGAFFSPYYLFDLLARQHADELDPEGREANRRLLRRPFRAAWARYGETGSTPGQAWQSWHRELFEALGLLGDSEGARLRRLDAPIETPRHGLVPISLAAYSDGDEAPVVFLDLHGFGTDLDRAYYPEAGASTPAGPITEEPIARAVEFALDHNDTRWAVVAAGDRLRLYRKGGSVARQYLEVSFPALFDADRNDEWTAFWGLFRYEAFLPDPETDKCLLDRILEESQRHASRIADDLRENVVLAVEALIQGVLDDPANRPVLGRADQATVKKLFVESLYFLYRLLFILYAESRDLLPVGESPVYRDTYSVEHLREMAERPLHAEDANKTYYIETLRALFQMLQRGFPPPGSALNPGFAIPPFNGQLFEPGRTVLLDRCRVPDQAMRRVIRELSLSRPRRRSDRRERYSYADLGVDQLGSIYEGLLVYEPAIVSEETVVAKVKGQERLVSLAQAEEYGLEIVEGSQKRPGSFVLRLWGGRRKGSGSYYTPAEITSFLVKEALEPLVEPIIQGCGERDSRDRPVRRPTEILELKVCDPAMGSGAFLIQACRYLAEAYGRARIAAGLDEDERISQEEFAQYKRRVAETCLYGVDLNPLAVELAKVSLWLETLARDRPLTFLDAHLRCGNSLIGAPLRDEKGTFTVERLSYVPDEALQEVSKEATKAQKAAARERIQRNRAERARAGRGDTPQMGMWDQLYADAIQTALTETLTRRLDLETSDEDLPLTDAVELVATKEQLFEELLHAADSRYRQAKEVCDLWCAAWFWPEPGTEIEAGQDGRSYTVIVPAPPTTQVFLELAGGILGTDPGSLDQDERQGYLLTARYTAREQRFFHWELEFAEVWREKSGRPRRNGGLDAIVGNPPWEIVKPFTFEFWSNYDPLFKEKDKQSALAFIEGVREHETTNTDWLSYSARIQQWSNYFRQSGQFLHQGHGDLNTYKLFVEKAYDLLAMQSHGSLIIPTAFNTDLGVAPLRHLLLKNARVHALLCLSNERFIFRGVAHNFKFALLTFSRGTPAASFAACFRYDVREAVALEELAGFLNEQKEKGLRVQTELLERFSPGTLTVLEFKRQRDIDLAQRIYADHPPLGAQMPSSWNVHLTTEFHLTNDSYLFNEQNNGYPLLEGRIVYLYDDRIKMYVSGRGRSAVWDLLLDFDSKLERWRPQWWVPENEARREYDRRGRNLDWRIAICRVTGPTNMRTVLSTIIPPESVTGNTLQIATVTQGNRVSHEVECFLVAIMNSFVMDYVTRLQIKNDVSHFILKKMPIPRLERGDPYFDSIVPRVSQLVCTREEFADLWYELAGTPWAPEVSAGSLAQRGPLMAEIDAVIADLYGLTEQDLAYILTTFPVLDPDQPPLLGEPKSYITRDLALLALFKLRNKTPPADIVAFFAAAGADISGITGPVRDLEQRVIEATRLGAVAYIPSGRGADGEVEPEDAAVQLALFEE